MLVDVISLLSIVDIHALVNFYSANKLSYHASPW